MKKKLKTVHDLLVYVFKSVKFKDNSYPYSHFLINLTIADILANFFFIFFYPGHPLFQGVSHVLLTNL